MKTIKSLFVIFLLLGVSSISAQGDRSTSNTNAINYETGKVTMAELKGTIIDIISPEQLVFQEIASGEKLVLRLAFIDTPEEEHPYYNNTMTFLKERVLNREAKVLLFNFNPKKHSCPAAYIEYEHKTVSEGIKSEKVVIGKVIEIKTKVLNVEILEGGFAKKTTRAPKKLSVLTEAEEKAKKLRLGVWAKQ